MICARTATVENASTVPITPISSGIAFCTTGAVATGTAAACPRRAAGGGVAWAASPPEQAASRDEGEPPKRDAVRVNAQEAS